MEMLRDGIRRVENIHDPMLLIIKQIQRIRFTGEEPTMVRRAARKIIEEFRHPSGDARHWRFYFRRGLFLNRGKECPVLRQNVRRNEFLKPLHQQPMMLRYDVERSPDVGKSVLLIGMGEKTGVTQGAH